MSILPFEDSQGYWRHDDLFEWFAWALGAQQLLVHLLDLHLLLTQILVAGFVLELESDLLLFEERVRHYRFADL
jgi:hypothetical protein